MGFVKAVDADEGINAMVTYFIPNDLPFTIDNETGEITTKAALDYEKQKVCNLCYREFDIEAIICRVINLLLLRKMGHLILELLQQLLLYLY